MNFQHHFCIDPIFGWLFLEWKEKILPFFVKIWREMEENWMDPKTQTHESHIFQSLNGRDGEENFLKYALFTVFKLGRTIFFVYSELRDLQLLLFHIL